MPPVTGSLRVFQLVNEQMIEVCRLNLDLIRENAAKQGDQDLDPIAFYANTCHKGIVANTDTTIHLPEPFGTTPGPIAYLLGSGAIAYHYPDQRRAPAAPASQRKEPPDALLVAASE